MKSSVMHVYIGVFYMYILGYFNKEETKVLVGTISKYQKKTGGN